jgi:hypothetical protein
VGGSSGSLIRGTFLTIILQHPVSIYLSILSYLFVYLSYPIYLSILSIYLWLCSPFVGPWPLIHTQSVVLLGRGSVHRKVATYTQNNKNTEKNAHIDIRALSGFRTHNPSFRASEDNSCLWLRDRCDRTACSTLYFKLAQRCSPIL